MRRLFRIAALALGLAGFSTATAWASNGLYITTNDTENNFADLAASGNDNVLSIIQTHDGLGSANTLSVSLGGDLNGGPPGAAFDGLPANLGLVPGRIEQTGHGNTIGVVVTGSYNIFAFSQIGAGNSLAGVIVGNHNQAAVLQMGAGNSLSFTQNGNGNSLSVVQQSR